MTIGLVPYGRLADGSYNLRIDDSTGNPLAAAIEIENTLPPVSSTDNFEGRTVFAIDASTTYVYVSNPSPTWVALDGIPATVDAVAGSPPTVPTPVTGSLFWDTDTQVMFVYDGGAWQAIGGRFAAQFVVQSYTGDGITTSFPMGVSQIVPTEYVEVFLDGVRQTPTTDYNVIGTNVVFSVAVPNNVKVLLRSVVSDAIVQTAQFQSATYTATAAQINFNAPAPQLDPAGIFVFVDGVLKTQGTDYTITSQNTTITSLTKTAATTARAICASPHGLSIGFPVTIAGAAEGDYNTTFNVTATPNATTFDFTVGVSVPGSATGNPVIYFNPAYINDVITFLTPMIGGEIVAIRTARNVVTAPSQGEANTLASVGSGVTLDYGKAGEVLQLKSVAAGPNVIVTDLGNEVQIAVTTVASFEDRRGVNVSSYTVNDAASYIGIRNTTNPVTVSLSGVPTGASSSGRKITIMDESGGAAVNNITVQGGGPFIDGLPTYVISTNYGSVTMVMDGNNWYVTNEKI